MAFNTAIASGYAAVNPLQAWHWDKVPKHEHRILTMDEELLVLDKSKEMYGLKFQTFVATAIETWGRLSEVLGLTWDDIRFDEACVWFRNTKSHEDRFVPIVRTSPLWGSLRRLQVQTLKDAGPFLAYKRRGVRECWDRMIREAKIEKATIHDLRRTGITRALLGGMAPVAVQAKAGHHSIETTMRYYVQVSKNDLREAVERLAKLA